MPKMKTHKATKKRLKVTGSGKIVHRRSGSAHLMRKKSSRRKRRYKVLSVISPRDMRRFRELIGPGGGL